MGRNSSIKDKLFQFILVLTLFLVVIIFIAVKISSDALLESVKKNTINVSQEMMTQIDIYLRNSIEKFESRAKVSRIIELLKEEQTALSKRNDIHNYLENNEKIWRSKTEDEISQSQMKTGLAQDLYNTMIKTQISKRGYTSFKNIIITNIYGANTLVLSKTKDYFQNEKRWWIEAKKKGEYIGDIEFDSDLETYVIPIAYSVVDEEGKFLGVIKTSLSVFEIVYEINLLSKLDSQKEIKILTNDGNIIYQSKSFKFFQKYDDKEILQKILHGERFIRTKNNMLLSVSESSLAPIDWYLILSYRVEDVLLPIKKLQKTLLIFIVVFILIILIIFRKFFNSITQPIAQLVLLTEEFRKNKKIERKNIKMATDEIGEFTKTFISMTEELNQFYENILMFKNLIENATQGFCIFDLDGKLVYINESLVKMEKNEFMIESTKYHYIKFYNEHRKSELISEVIPDVLEFGEYSSENCIELSGNEKIVLKKIYFPIKNDKNEIKYIANIVSDISLERKINEKMQIATEAAIRATEAKSNFLANMSHEIRTPMNAIIGLNDLLFSTALNFKQKDYVGKIESSAKNLLGIINDILDFSKIEAGKLEIENTHFELDDVLEQLVNITELKANKKNVEFIVMKDKKVPNKLIGDPLRLQQVLLNLLSNAIKFTEKGEILMRISRIRKNDGLITLCFNVIDTGIGISDEQMERLFDSFSQADETTTRKYGGTGLGLAISKSLVEMMGGEISVESTYNKGTRFYFETTFRMPEEKEYVEGLKLNKKLKILVGDSNSKVRKAIHYCLSDLTSDLKLTASSDEILVEISKADYDIIFIDYKLLNLDSLNINEKIKELKKENRMPLLIVMMSYKNKNIEKNLKEAGIDSFIYKPLLKTHFMNIITKNFIENKREEVIQNLNNRYPAGFEKIKGAKILLVEDNKINQQVAKEVLERQGFWIDLAENGQEGLECIYKNNYDIVLLDLQMPVLDGYSTAQVIRENRKFDKLPIVALSADAMLGTRERVLKLGMNDYLTKPIDKNKLFEILTKWIKEGEREIFVANDIEPENSSSQLLLKKTLNTIDTDEALNRLSGNVTLYLNILSKFKKNYTEFLDEIEKYFETSEKTSALNAVHTLKGTSGNIGAIRLHKSSLELEKIMKKSDNLLEISKKEEFLIFSKNLSNVLDEIILLEDMDRGIEVNKNKISASDEELKTKMTELGAAIENYNTEALIKFENIAGLLLNSSGGDKVKKLGELIEEYEFEEALNLFNDINTDI